MRQSMQQQSNRSSLWDGLRAAGHLSSHSLWDFGDRVTLGDLVHGSSLGAGIEGLCGRSVLVATEDQLTAALALIELDGIARRLVLCPPDLPVMHLSSVIATAGVDAIVSDRPATEIGIPSACCLVPCSPRVSPAEPERSARYQTEWILLTSGTAGLPKLVS